MLRKLLSIAALFSALFCGPLLTHVHAQSSTLSCEDANTTVEQIACLTRLHDGADAHLNSVYKTHRATLDDEGQLILRTAQRAWIEFRDTECARQADVFRGGSLVRIIAIDCQLNLTALRTNQLLESGSETIEDPEQSPIFWQSLPPLIGKFDCENFLPAQLGLVTSRDRETLEPFQSARLNIGTHQIDIPIDHGGDSLCGPDVSLHITDPASSCPGLRVDDGLCDAFFFSWNKNLGTYQYERN